MPRDSSGVYTLPVGNPVVTGTIIASTWANSTMSDIAAQLNNVLTRDGLLGPTGPFKLQDGTVNAPGLAFASEVGLGWYRPGAGNINIAVGGQAVLGFTTTALTSAISLYPRTAGATDVRSIWALNPSGAVDNSILNIFMRSDAAWIISSAAGAGATKPLNIGANGINLNAAPGLLVGATGRFVRAFSTTGSGNYTVPVGVGKIVAILQGPGGGGGGCQGTDATSFAMGGGGGAGGTCIGYVNVTAGQVLAYSLPAGGAGGTPGGGGFTASSATFIGMTAGGGGGGSLGVLRAIASGGSYMVQDGAGLGLGGAASSGNIANIPGENARPAFMTNITAGQMAGVGGNSMFGSAAYPSFGTQSGSGPAGFGAGGNGGSLNNSVGGGAAGSNGGPSMLMIYEYSD